MGSPRRPLRQEWLTWNDVDQLVDVLLPQLRSAGTFDAMIMITRGGIVPGGLLCEALDITNVLTAAVDFPRELDRDDKARLLVWPSFIQFPEDELVARRRLVIVDDVWGSGRTSTAVKSRCEAAGAQAAYLRLPLQPLPLAVPQCPAGFLWRDHRRVHRLSLGEPARAGRRAVERAARDAG